MISGTDSSGGWLSPEQKSKLLKVIGTTLLSIISIIFGVEIGGMM